MSDHFSNVGRERTSRAGSSKIADAKEEDPHERTVAFLACASFGVAFAQAKPAPPPIWKQGMPATMADSKLAPLAGR